RTPGEDTAKKLSSFLNNELDEIKILSGIRSIVPDVYLRTENRSKNSISNKTKEIVLSEYLYAKGE
ncbi:MAG: hypothetical protein LUH05_03615, partial [Candidatus Gastranaerophilales bacterium]|nr:hypothetical protein [Candidatus Gastranaerophilales bacterium]